MYFEEIDVGAVYISPGRTITEADLFAFAGLSGDFAELHTNEEVMQEHPFGRRVAHGLLVVAIQSGLAIRALPAIRFSAALGIDHWRFRAPVFIGDTIHLRLTVAEARERRSDLSTGVVVLDREVVNQHAALVQDGRTAALVERYPRSAP